MTRTARERTIINPNRRDHPFTIDGYGQLVMIEERSIIGRRRSQHITRGDIAEMLLEEPEQALCRHIKRADAVVLEAYSDRMRSRRPLVTFRQKRRFLRGELVVYHEEGANAYARPGGEDAVSFHLAPGRG